MDWNAIGAVGEVAGAFAVVGTLFYLASQIRQNTRAMKASALTAITNNVQAELRSTFMNPAIASAIQKSLSVPSELTDTEIVHLQGYYVSSLMARQLEYFQHKEQLINDEVWDSLNFATRAILGNEWARHWWKAFGRHTFASSFVSYVESQSLNQPPARADEHFIALLRSKSPSA